MSYLSISHVAAKGIQITKVTFICCLCLNNDAGNYEKTDAFLGCLNQPKQSVLMMHCGMSEDTSSSSICILLILPRFITFWVFLTLPLHSCSLSLSLSPLSSLSNCKPLLLPIILALNILAKSIAAVASSPSYLFQAQCQCHFSL